uniref:Uncharacterized protein n=1 Tax=Neovison vison TaxID=452646 RepID=A0A8C7EP52_NEOVI
TFILKHLVEFARVQGVGPHGAPLCLQATEVRTNPMEFNPNFLACMIPIHMVLHLIKAPKEPIGGYEYDKKFLKQMHHLLLEMGVSEGTLQSPKSPQEDVWDHSSLP